MDARERHAKASELFVEAIGLSPQRREAMLAEACAGDPALLGDVLTLLQHDAPEPQVLVDPPGAEEESLVGRTLGRYEIVGELGRGAMGTVWKANDTVLERVVALKFMPQKSAGADSARRRFLREARAAAALKHEGIATVFDTGEIEERVFIAMEYIDGQTVAEHIREGPLAPARAVAVALATAKALGYAHREGIVHRDIAPKNIILTRNDRSTIVDFGLALQDGVTRTTRQGVTVGTLAYIAPELFFEEDAGRQSDIYSLGVTLYEMLTGHLPFPGSYPHDLIHASIHFAHEPPGALVEGLPPALDDVVARAIAKTPGDRFESAEEMAEALEAIVAAGGLAATPAGPVRPPVPTRSRGQRRSTNRFPLKPLMVAAVVLVLGVVITWLVMR